MELFQTIYPYIGLPIFFGLGITIFLAMVFRRVVPTNEVHIVQSAGATTSYGKDTTNGNSYYEWPSWIPVFGINKVVLPVSVFDIDLENYEAYDKGRLPFSVDVKAFFRIKDSNKAAQSVASFNELQNQLLAIVQGAVRTVLAQNDIEEIMEGRGKFGDEFTREVNEQLANWGVETVKNIELMDLRDGNNGHAIHNIMEKKKSHIQMESRTEVAKNNRIAEMAEIEATREIDLQKQQASQAVGLRTVENKKEVALADQIAVQQVKEQERITKEKEMAVKRVSELKQAEIEKDKAVVKAEQEQITLEKVAQGQLKATELHATGITATGKAQAEAEKLKLMAPVEAQTTLAKEIGSNESYQKYLITIEQVKASQAVGIEQAKALQKSSIKVFANSGSPADGINSVSELFTSGGGMKAGAMLEGLMNTPVGKQLLKQVGVVDETKDSDVTLQ